MYLSILELIPEPDSAMEAERLQLGVHGTGDPQMMSGGISQALVTTVLGLVMAIPLLFGVAILVLWEGITRGLNVPTVLLPPPTMM